MGVIKKNLISDVELSVLQSAPSDDTELERDQIAQWANDNAHDLIRREIVEEMKRGRMIPPIYVKREIALELEEETVTDIAAAQQRFYVELEDEVLDLPKDAGVVRVLDYDLNLIHKTSVEQLESLRHMKWAKPGLDNILYYRQEKKIFIEGFNTADVDFNNIIVDYVLKQDIVALDEDGEIIISDQLVPILRDMCIQQAKLMLYGTQADQLNDGTDNKSTSYHLGIANQGVATTNAQSQLSQQE